MIVSPALEHDGRFSCEELDALIPRVARNHYHEVTTRNYNGKFDPHWPYHLPSTIQTRLVNLFQGLHLCRRPDGRFSGPCPLPHRNGLTCNCDSGFYASPVSGSWCCFCSDHLGQSSGTVQAFALLGLDTDLTPSEIQAEIGKPHLGPGEITYRKELPSQSAVSSHEGIVADRVSTNNPIYRKSDKTKDRGRRPLLWQEARQLFPIPSNVKLSNSLESQEMC